MIGVQRVIVAAGIAALAAKQLRWFAGAVRDHAQGRAYDPLDAYNLLVGTGMVFLLVRFLWRVRREDLAVLTYAGLVVLDFLIMYVLAVMTLPLGD
jgi:hypothetical protein